MSYTDPFDNSYETRLKRKMKTMRWQKMHLDPTLIVTITILASIGLCVLYSASNQNMGIVKQQIFHLGFAFLCMVAVAQISPSRLQQCTPGLYILATLLLILVLLVGHVSQGARRWLGVGMLQIQPSEIMKLAMPMMLAWLMDKGVLPPTNKTLALSMALLLVPILLTIKQPDLGTAILIGVSGCCVILLAGISWKYLIGFLLLCLLAAPICWHFLHDYQKLRILTLIDPQRDPLGAGYNIIQSKIAVGSGGILGKGWLKGTQSHLAFLPTHTTDFIFAVSAEEWGFMGALTIWLAICLVFSRALYICTQAQSCYTRLLCGSLSCTFLLNALINIAMVIGLVPVVGVPLPLISYGGSSMVTTFISFGILMSIHTHKKLWSS